MLRKLAWLAVSLALVPAPVRAQATASDQKVLQQIIRDVNGYTRFTVFDDLAVAVDQGAVVVTGKVTMPFKRDDIGRVIARVEGVRSVENNIQVLPTSTWDDQLRVSIARAIYGNPSFWSYAAMAHPPIHIVVDRGHVTLTGVVNNEVERTLARSIASASGAFSVESQLRTDAEARRAPGFSH